MKENEKTLAEQITGAPPLPKFLLDSSVLDEKETDEAVREDIKLNRIEFVFPAGLAQVNIFEECRALCDLENFDLMYDLTMSLLEGKDLEIWLKDGRGKRHCIGSLHIVDKYQNLQSLECIQESPWIVNWLVEFMAAHLGKKYPRLPKNAVQPAGEKAKPQGTATMENSNLLS